MAALLRCATAVLLWQGRDVRGVLRTTLAPALAPVLGRALGVGQAARDAALGCAVTLCTLGVVEHCQAVTAWVARTLHDPEFRWYVFCENSGRRACGRWGPGPSMWERGGTTLL